MTVMTFLKQAARICRAPIAFFAAYAAATGYILAPQRSLPSALMISFAVAVLAAGASVLNQYQERHIDARMERTRHRPLPAGLIRPAHALSAAVALISAGLALLAFRGGPAPAILGTAAVLWYNGLYTHLKRLTAFAAVPGAVVGMIPPAIGWIAGGGTPADPRLVIVCLLFFMWQVPHFWLQVLHHGDEYERAGLPSLTKLLDKTQIARITFAWICSTAVGCLLLPLYGSLTSPLLYGPLLFTSIWVMVKSVKLVAAGNTPALPLAVFKQLNIFIFSVMSLLSVEKVLIHLP